MALKLLLTTHSPQRQVNAPHLAPLVIAGVESPGGKAVVFRLVAEPDPGT